MALMFTSCSNKQSQEQKEDSNVPKALVLYYSQTGATKAVAEQLQSTLNADIEAIEAVDPYSGTYDETIQRCIKERNDSIIPEIKPLKTDLAQYDIIFLGYPVWFGTYARPIYGLLANNEFEGKKIVPFCTFGSGGLEATTADLKAALPKAQILDGYGVRNARVDKMPEELNYFLITNGYLAGEVEPLPEYSAQADVTPEQAAIFDQACGDYQFPLGTPVTVGLRKTASSTDYKFVANSKDMQGQDIQSVIYVTVPVAPDAKPEFTRVVR